LSKKGYSLFLSESTGLTAFWNIASSVVKAFDLDGSSTGKGTIFTMAMPVAGRNV
jgi:hypothetical protein